MSLRLSRRLRLTVDIVLAVVTASGVAWLWLDRGDAVDVATRGLLRQDVRLHAIAAVATIYVAGMLWFLHVRRAWRSHRNRVAGVATLCLVAFLVLSGYVLDYFTDEASHGVVARAHWLAGLVAVAVYLAHRWHGARTRSPIR
jgi:cation transport ATPase